MRQVTLEAMESLLLRYKGRYTAVVGFKPTGWSHAGGAGRSGQAGAAGGGGAAAAAVPAGPSRSSLSIKPNRRRSQRGTVVLYQVCTWHEKERGGGAGSKVPLEFARCTST